MSQLATKVSSGNITHSLRLEKESGLCFVRRKPSVAASQVGQTDYSEKERTAMANVRTKKNQFPMNLGHRDFNNKYNWQGKYQVPLPPPIPDPVYPERPKSKYRACDV